MVTVKFPEGYQQPDEGSESLIGCDGNAYAIMGHVTRKLRRAGNRSPILDEYRRQATSGDYDELLTCSMMWLDGVEG